MAAPVEVDVIVLGVGTCGDDLSLRLLDAGLEVVGIEAHHQDVPFWVRVPGRRALWLADFTITVDSRER